MKIKLSRAIALAFAGLTWCSAYAEDIDIYTQGTASSASNVLIFIDNSSNWSNSRQQWDKSDALAKCGSADSTDPAVVACRKYTNLIFGADSKLVQGQVELRALKQVLQEISCTEELGVNVGLMLYNTEGTVDSASGVSGYIRRRILELPTAKSMGFTLPSDLTPDQLAAAIKEKYDSCVAALPKNFALIQDLDNIDANITGNDFKGPSSGDYGSSMYEVFKYFGGYANTSGREATAMGSPAGAKGFGPTRYSLKNSLEDADAFVPDTDRKVYKSPIQEGFCGKNYLLLIGNAFPNAEFDPNSPPKSGINGVMERIGLTPKQIYDERVASNTRYADEWAQFLAGTDVSSLTGQQPVKTFTINVFNKTFASPTDDLQARLLDSMAINGGPSVGGAFKVDGNIGALIKAIKDVLLQISARNSAFASASLPISVNTQGTYLNQVFIGMFRPGADGRPRWAGNLKQYQFAIKETSDGSTTKRTLYLADAKKEAAIDNTNTGFLQGCATSFWTKSSDPANYWQSVTDPKANKDVWQIPEGSCTSDTKYNDAPDGSVVERGGVAQNLRNMTPSKRVIQTCNTSSCTSAKEFGDADASVAAWVRGTNVGDGYNSTSAANPDDIQYGKDAATMRPTVHGGVIHSRPLAINYGSGTKDNVVVYYGADDGLLRAINGNKTSDAGNELWSFIAPEFVSRLQRNRDNYPLITFFDDPTSPKDYFFDGSLGAYAGPANTDGTGAAVKYLYASMRRGGRMIYAFNITKHPAETDGTPVPMWRFGCPTTTNTDNTGCVGGSGVEKIGQTWSTPKLMRVKGASTLFAIFGAGYDKCEDSEPRTCSTAPTGRGIFVLDAVTGELKQFIDFSKISSSAGRVVADVVPVDTDNDGYTDIIYAADTSGNLWRVNLSSNDPANWVITHVAMVADWSVTSKSRKFLYAPDVVTIGEFNIVLIGTGNREKPLEKSAAALVKNRFYGFWDSYKQTTKSSPAFVTIDDRTDCDKAGDAVTDTGCDLMNTSTASVTGYLTAFSDPLLRPRGWVIDLENTANEQVVTTGATVGGLVNFSTFRAGQEVKDGEPVGCSALGTARGYAACFLHGGASCDDVPPAGASRSNEFAGGGLPPSPVTGVVEVDGKIVPFIIGGKPEAGSGSPLEAKLPPIPIKKNRTKVYRYKKID
ncbi:pilus assembly protein [Aromatoleum petrolei]|uniref:Pilus assembly protein n=1 Tax=Aromatoleum petrolei TaxID=76116 RepID=A0ABX1MLT9_9RHOO|nr:PilC/PilY family type IV pilus protein [Aromatoleum petrolei]NMF88922.1 pilus assembly protein [Aromatoleum petrolei]QTQ37783.1 PilC beta-propeller domain-containing protein [Aromatoleum petrolei]